MISVTAQPLTKDDDPWGDCAPVESFFLHWRGDEAVMRVSFVMRKEEPAAPEWVVWFFAGRPKCRVKVGLTHPGPFLPGCVLTLDGGLSIDCSRDEQSAEEWRQARATASTPHTAPTADPPAQG